MGESHRLSLDRFAPKKAESTFCSFPDCKELTNEGKPYCKEHVLQMPYVSKLVEIVELRATQGLRDRDEVDPYAEPKKRQPSIGRTIFPVFNKRR